jgi:hypothetical protein
MMRRDENVEKVGELVKKRCFVTVVQQSKYGLDCLTVEVPRSHTIRHTHTHTTLPCTSDQLVAQAATYTTQETNIQALNRICTHDSSNKAATDLHLRLHGHMDQP